MSYAENNLVARALLALAEVECKMAEFHQSRAVGAAPEIVAQKRAEFLTDAARELLNPEPRIATMRGIPVDKLRCEHCAAFPLELLVRDFEAVCSKCRQPTDGECVHEIDHQTGACAHCDEPVKND